MKYSIDSYRYIGSVCLLSLIGLDGNCTKHEVTAAWLDNFADQDRRYVIIEELPIIISK